MTLSPERTTNVESQFDKEFWGKQRIVITGGSGFLGSHIRGQLSSLSPEHVFAPRSGEFDLRNLKACRSAFNGQDIIIHLAAEVGGIGYNKKYPADLFLNNLLITVNVLKAAHEAGVKKFVGIGTICSYPKYTQVPFKEEALWDGYPEETNAPYGLAKKMLLVGSKSLNEQYGFNAINLLLVNLYGPGDNFSPESSHVIPALIRKFVEAKEKGEKRVVVWGTGKATREFLYVAEAARGILLATEKHSNLEPINIGAGFEISIRRLSEIIKRIVGFGGEIVWDQSKPDGQPRRMLDTSKALRHFGFQATTTLEKGLEETIDWYLKNRDRKSG